MATLLNNPLLVGEFSVEIDAPEIGVYFSAVVASGVGNGEQAVSVVADDTIGQTVNYMKDLEDNFFVYSGSAYTRAPSEFNLGTISGDSETPIMVWNSSSHSVQLDSISATGVGSDSITVYPSLAPKLYKTGECKYSALHVSADGQDPAIEATLTFNFSDDSNVQDVQFQVSALRIALFAFRPDFSESAKLTFETSTNVIRKLNGSEQRINTLQGFAKSYTFKTTTLTRKDSARLKAFLHKHAGKKFAVPYWIDSQPIQCSAGTSTFNFGTQNFTDFSQYQMFALIDAAGNFELMTVQGFTSDSVSSVQQCVREYGRGSELVPVEIVQLSEDNYKLTEFTTEHASVSLTFDTFIA